MGYSAADYLNTSLCSAPDVSRLEFLDLPNRSPCLINCAICIGVGAGVRVGNRDPSKRLARDFARGDAALEPEFIPQRVVFVGVSMRPAVHRDGRNVARRIKTTRTQRSGELFAYFAFDGFKLGCEKFDSAHAMLVACGQ